MKFKHIVPTVISAVIVAGMFFTWNFFFPILEHFLIALILIGLHCFVMGLLFQKGYTRIAFGILTGLFVVVGGLLVWVFEKILQ